MRYKDKAYKWGAQKNRSLFNLIYAKKGFLNYK